MNKVNIEWLGNEERNVPNYGVMTAGRKTLMDSALAESFKKQGLLKIVTPIATRKTEEDS